MGMKGPITRREVAERVLKEGVSAWSLADETAAKLLYLQQQVSVAMREPHSNYFVERHLGHIPREYRAALHGLPRFICITPGGGRGAQHVLSLLATREEWEMNISLKDRVVEAAQMSADEARSIRALLMHEQKQSLSEVLGIRPEDAG